MSTLQTVADLCEQVEHLAFFGWVWEPAQTANVPTAAKADTAPVVVFSMGMVVLIQLWNDVIEMLFEISYSNVGEVGYILKLMRG
jgi:hypothetical protein